MKTAPVLHAARTASKGPVVARSEVWYSPGSAGGLAPPCPPRSNARIGGGTISRDLRVNQMIRIPQVRVIDEEGNQLGVMPTPQALEMAQERGLDLVEVAPMAPPVVRFLDFGQYKYELTKREKEAKRRQRSVTFKEVRLSPKIGIGRLRHQGPSGDRVPRGRRPDQGDGPLPGSRADPPGARPEPAGEVHGQDQGSRRRGTDAVLEGKSMFITVASIHKPKEHEARQAGGDRGAAGDARPAARAPARPTPAPAQADAAPAAPATEPTTPATGSQAGEPRRRPSDGAGQPASGRAEAASRRKPAAAAAKAQRPQPPPPSRRRRRSRAPAAAPAATGE